MTTLRQGQSLYPFWGEPVSLITGLDPLGLQNTSEATYSLLLMGITNLTNRIRYYGFYCWLIDLYFKNEKKGNSKEQYRFIRRAELMIAIIMQSQNRAVLQITGSNFASNLISTNDRPYFDLAEGADKGNEKVYWQYPSGAFGQYYYGAMHALSLVIMTTNDRDMIYNITEPHSKYKVSGKELADAFDATLTPEIRDKFYNNIKKGTLYRTDIIELFHFFSIDRIKVNTQEWQLYVSMLLDKDEPSQELEEYCSYFRRDTIISLIKEATQNNYNFDCYKYISACYKRKLETIVKPESDTGIGWYCYQLNEFWQFACGTIFFAVLNHLKSFQQEQYLPAFIKDFSFSIVNEITQNLQIEPKTTILDVLMLVEKDEEQLIDSSHDIKKEAEKAMYGFLLLFKLCQNNKEQLSSLKEFRGNNQVLKDGNAVEGLLSILSQQNEPLQTFIEQFILRNIIYRHQMVAYRKMGNGTQATHKFLIEEQYIRFIDSFPPRFSSPRMNALQNILFDLQIIDEKNRLTPLHTTLLHHEQL